MYVTSALDVLSQVVIEVSLSPENDEIGAATHLIKNFEKESITLYDRLYLSERLIKSHQEHGSMFFAKCKKGSTFKEISDFYKSSKSYQSVTILDNTIHLHKIRKNKTTHVFATNAPKSLISKNEVWDLYSLRWESETFNRDITETLKIEQWHSKSINGIKQEIYTLLWSYNFAKIQIWNSIGRKNINRISRKYAKANFKAVFKYIFDHIVLLVKRSIYKMIDRIESLVSRTLEKRTRNYRSYLRIRRTRNKKFAGGSLVERRSS